MHYNHFNPRALENIDKTVILWKGLAMRLQYQRQETHTEFPKNAAIWYTKRPSYYYKQYRITQDQVSVLTNYMI